MFLDVELATEKQKKTHKAPGVEQFPSELTRMRSKNIWAGNVTTMEECRSAFNTVMGKHTGRSLERARNR